MTSDKKIVRLVGILFLVQMIAAVLSYSVILDPILYGSQDFLTNLPVHSFWVTISVFLDLTCGLAVFGIAILLYPILKRHNERIALWYVGLRLSELFLFAISGVLLLTLLSMSLNFEGVDPNDESSYNILAKYLLNARGSTQDISLILYSFGTSMFYYLLYRAKLVPRFISIWGLIAVGLLFVEITSNIFRESLGGIIIMMPLGLNELFLGIWLIIKGFMSDDSIAI